MDKQHIADSSSHDREEHLPFPYMECTSHNHGYEFGKSVWCRHYIHISEAVYDKQTEYRRRQKFSEILHECRSWSFFIKNCKWQEAGEHCSRKMTTNMAVITKLIPLVSNLSREPISPPVVAADTQ